MENVAPHTETPKVITPNYTTIFTRNSKHWVKFERSHTWQSNDREIDVFGPCWSLAWPSFANNQVSVATRSRIHPINGPLAVLVPPFSIVDWRFRGGTIYWQGIISDAPWPHDFPKKAIVYTRKEDEVLPATIDELKDFLRLHQPTICIDKEETLSAVAHQTKKFIDQHWQSEFSIGQLANALGYNIAVIDRAFKDCYGLTPCQYRNRMRVLEAANRLLLKSESVTNLAFDVGFTGIANFQKQFKKLMLVPPSNYQIKTY